MSLPAHLLAAHFPVALLVAGAALDLAGTAAGRTDWRRTAGALLLAGAAAAFVALLTGPGAAGDLAARSPAPNPRIDTHTQAAVASLWLIAGTGVLRAMWRRRLDGARGWICLAAALASAAAVIAVSLAGAAISHAP